MEKDNIVELIKKCLALSKSPNENEAALAMAKAQELLLKYNLDMAQIKTSDNAQSNDEACMINDVVDFSNFSPWQSQLLNCISIRNFCKIIRIDRHEYHILGTRANVRSVEAMYNWVEPQIIRLILQSGYKRGEKSAYAYGIINTIGKRLDESLIQYKRNNPMSTALIINVQHAIDIYYKEQYPHATTRRVSITGNNAYYAGQSDGHNVVILKTKGEYFMTHEDRIWGKLTESKKDKYAAIAAGETFFRVCYLDRYNQWYPLWNIRDFETFEMADNAAREIATKLKGEYISLR